MTFFWVRVGAKSTLLFFHVFSGFLLFSLFICFFEAVNGFLEGFWCFFVGFDGFMAIEALFWA